MASGAEPVPNDPLLDFLGTPTSLPTPFVTDVAVTAVPTIGAILLTGLSADVAFSLSAISADQVDLVILVNILGNQPLSSYHLVSTADVTFTIDQGASYHFGNDWFGVTTATLSLFDAGGGTVFANTLVGDDSGSAVNQGVGTIAAGTYRLLYSADHTNGAGSGAGNILLTGLGAPPGGGGSTVPEPATLTLAALGLAAGTARRATRRAR